MDTKIKINAVEDSRKWKEASSVRLFKMSSSERIRTLNEGVAEKLKKLAHGKVLTNQS